MDSPIADSELVLCTASSAAGSFPSHSSVFPRPIISPNSCFGLGRKKNSVRKVQMLYCSNHQALSAPCLGVLLIPPHDPRKGIH